MKIGILTFHRAENFGAALQACALQNCLEDMGHSAYIIDYRCPSIEARYHILNPSILFSRKNVIISAREYLKRFPTLTERRTRKSKYVDFRKKYLKILSLEQMRDLDAFITGSDQVWNPHLTGGINRMYFLDFPESEGKIKISYAASSDKDPDKILERNAEKVTRALSNFTAISVREESFRKTIEQFTKKTVDVCCDPTFLLDKEKYASMATTPEEKSYILVYQMTESTAASEAAAELARRKGCGVIEIHGGYVKGKDKKIHKTDLGPEEILGYILNAECIITTSFHGFALSLILNKQVWVIDKGDNLRQKNLAKLVDIEHRIVKGYEQQLFSTHIDYSSILPKIETIRNTSINFLKTLMPNNESSVFH